MIEDIIVQSLINYGLAGIVILLFYRLLSNEMKELVYSINELNKNINTLLQIIKNGGCK